MTLPAGWSAVQVTGRYLDTAGAPCSGTVTFTATARLVDQAAKLMVLPAAVVATLDADGAFTVTLAATDDPDLQPAFSWRVDELVNGRAASYPIALPAAVPVVDLADLVPS